jgi:hypothetical protein
MGIELKQLEVIASRNCVAWLIRGILVVEVSQFVTR